MPWALNEMGRQIHNSLQCIEIYIRNIKSEKEKKMWSWEMEGSGLSSRAVLQYKFFSFIHYIFSSFKHTLCRSCPKYHFCRDTHFVITKMCLLIQIRVCRDKTHVLSRQKYACRDKWQTWFCCNKTFVATKMILVAALANDICHGPWPRNCKTNS